MPCRNPKSLPVKRHDPLEYKDPRSSQSLIMQTAPQESNASPNHLKPRKRLLTCLPHRRPGKSEGVDSRANQVLLYIGRGFSTISQIVESVLLVLRCPLLWLVYRKGNSGNIWSQSLMVSMKRKWESPEGRPRGGCGHEDRVRCVLLTSGVRSIMLSVLMCCWRL
jgi:hypothetical protein